MYSPKSHTYRVGPNHPNHPTGVAAPPYHIVAAVTPAAHDTATIDEARTVSMLPMRSRMYRAKDGRQLRWKMPANTPSKPASVRCIPNSFGESIARLLDRLSLNRSRSQNTQCQREAAHSKPANTICETATPSIVQRLDVAPVPVADHPDQEVVTPRRAMNGRTYIPWRHMGLNT